MKPELLNPKIVLIQQAMLNRVTESLLSLSFDVAPDDRMNVLLVYRKDTPPTEMAIAEQLKSEIAKKLAGSANVKIETAAKDNEPQSLDSPVFRIRTASEE